MELPLEHFFFTLMELPLEHFFFFSLRTFVFLCQEKNLAGPPRRVRQKSSVCRFSVQCKKKRGGGGGWWGRKEGCLKDSGDTQVRTPADYILKKIYAVLIDKIKRCRQADKYRKSVSSSSFSYFEGPLAFTFAFTLC